MEGRNNKKISNSTNFSRVLHTHIKNRPGRKGEEEEDEAGRSTGHTILYFLGEDQKEGEEPESQGNKIIFFFIYKEEKDCTFWSGVDEQEPRKF